MATRSRLQSKSTQQSRKRKTSRAPGLPARQLAVNVLSAILSNGRALDDMLLAEAEQALPSPLDARDRAFARLVVMTVLRRKCALDHVVDQFVTKPLPAKHAKARLILLGAASQLIYLNTPPHAVISVAVDQINANRNTQHLAGLVNAVLRRIAEQRDHLTSERDNAQAEVPSWLWSRWVKAFGKQQAHTIAAASLIEAALDLTVKAAPEEWARRLGGVKLSTGTVRLATGGRVDRLDGFTDGAWWVQDAAASLPAKLLGDVAGKHALDLCAAPGGKTAQLAAAGAHVTALDIDASRIRRLKTNLTRLRLDAELIEADATGWVTDRKFDLIILDAPCSATGTIRRHPDILHLRREADIAKLAGLQSRLLDNAFQQLRPGGQMIYCTCSLECEEAEQQISAFLKRTSNAVRHPIAPGEGGVKPAWLNEHGDMRTLPFHDPNPERAPDATLKSELSAGMDGFFASRILRAAG